MQNKLNIKTCGAKWSQGITDKNKEINWDLAILMETAEIIDSTPWKHWKSVDDKIDMQNIHMELTDIWHFIMSKNLQDGTSKKEIAEAMYYYFKKVQRDEKVTNDKSQESIIRACNKIIAQAIDDNKPLDIHPQGSEYFIPFFELCKKTNLDYETLTLIYHGKNVLNRFRQDNNYQDSSKYKKLWNINGKDMEDNQALMQILMDLTYEKNLAPSHEQIYSCLEEKYNGQ